MAKKVIKYTDFRGGHYGRHGPWEAAPRASYLGENMITDVQGELSLRMGYQDLMGSSEVFPTDVQILGTMGGFGILNQSEVLWWIETNGNFWIYTLSGDPQLINNIGALIPNGTLYDWTRHGNDAYVTIDSIGTFHIAWDGATATLTDLSGAAPLAPTGAAIAIFGERMLIADIDGSFGYRVRFSDPADFTSWPTANFFDVGDQTPITAMLNQRQHLVIMKENSFWHLNGTPGVNASLRQVSQGYGPQNAQMAGSSGHETIWFQSIATDYPLSWNGARVRNWDTQSNQDVFSTAVQVTPFGIEDGGAVFHNENGDLIMFYRGAWSNHTIGVKPLDANAYKTATSFTPVDGSPSCFIYYVDANDDVRLLRFRPDYGFFPFGFTTPPGVEFFGGDEEDVIGEFDLPEWNSEQEEVTIQAIIVDFRQWDRTAFSESTNHFDVQVVPTRRYDDTDSVLLELDVSTPEFETFSFDEASDAFTTPPQGRLSRRTFRPANSTRTGGFQLRFRNVRGVAFQRITVIVDTLAARD